jgi:hypothetical protein
MPEHRHDRTLAELETALKSLSPAPAQIGRDLLLFRAGQASMPQPSWLWPGTAAALGALSLILGFILVTGPRSVVVTQPIVVQQPQPAPPANPVPKAPQRPPEAAPAPSVPEQPSQTLTWSGLPGDYLRRRNEVLRWGVEALPLPSDSSAAPPPPRPMTAHDLFDWFPNHSAPASGGSL